MRTILAFILSPLIPSLYFCLDVGDYLLEVTYTYISSTLIAVPIFLVLLKLKKETFLTYCLVGFGAGALFVLITMTEGVPRSDDVFPIIFYGAFGLSVSFIFRLIRGTNKNV